MLYIFVFCLNDLLPNIVHVIRVAINPQYTFVSIILNYTSLLFHPYYISYFIYSTYCIYIKNMVSYFAILCNF